MREPFFEATVLTDLPAGSPSSYEELFGPVAVIYRVANEAAAIALANDSPFGLGGSVFSQNIARATHVADQLDTGMVFIKHPTWTAPELPFGGVKTFRLRPRTLRARHRRIRQQEAHPYQCSD